jgi:hypothetical protein
MPRERVVLTREPDPAGRPQPSPQAQAEFNRAYRRGFMLIGVGALFDIACAILIVAGQFATGVAAGVVGILIGLLAARQFTRAGREVEARIERGY